MAGSEEEASLRTACPLPFQRREGALGERGRSTQTEEGASVLAFKH